MIIKLKIFFYDYYSEFLFWLVRFFVNISNKIHNHNTGIVDKYCHYISQELKKEKNND